MTSSSFTVANTGDKWSTGSFSAHVRGKWGSFYIERDVFFSGLAAGQSMTWLPSPSQCGVSVYADSTNTVSEQSETNNRGYGSSCSPY